MQLTTTAPVFGAVDNNMALTREAVDKLAAIHKEVTSESLSDHEAWEMATRLLEFGSFAAGRDPDSAAEAMFDTNELS